ncbi:MAG TPA: transposase [Polyangiaceae bacterium]
MSQRGAAHCTAGTQQARGRGGATRIEVTLDGLRQLIDRIDHEQLERDDWPLIRGLVWNEFVGKARRQERTIARVLAAARAEQDARGQELDADATSPDHAATESPASSGRNATSDSLSSDAKASGNEPASAETGSRRNDETNPVNADKPKGHGRNGASAYRQAQHISHPLAPGKIGAQCEKCGHGKLHRYREKVVIRIVGQPMFGAEVHHHEQGRCRACGHSVRAESPTEVCEGLGTDYIRYDWSACAMLMVMHYFGGAPFKRIESLHAGWGVPMPDANQWQVVNAGDDLLLPLYRALEQHAIQKATNFRIDDTGSMVITLQRQIAAEIAALESLGKSTKDVRTGINATGVYWQTPNGPVLLFYTGRHHAGEIVDRLLRHRLLSSPKLVKCTDGASKNFDHEHADQLVEATCNAHAFLKFRAIKDKYPVEYAEAGRVYQQVFDRDDEAKALGLSSVDRMRHHRKHSKPLLEQLKKMCQEKITSKLVEPSSRLWEPLTFIINQWDRLTRFCDVPGVPLDTNLVEQALIMPVRYLAGSFNYQTEDGAVVGDHAMSLIATARASDVEPVAWLTECLRCHADLAQRPEHYLPWVYRERLEGPNTSGAAPRAPPPPRPRLEPEPGFSAQSA